MKLKHVLTAAVAVATLTTAFEASAAWLRCDADPLGINDATGRNNWALAHGYITQEEYNFAQANQMYAAFDKGSYIYGAEGDPNNPRVWVSSDKPAIGYTAIYVYAFCKAGCYTPQQRIMTEQGLVSVKEAHDSGIETVMALTASTSLGNIQLAPQPIEDFIIGDTNEIIYLLEGDGGQKLEVTSEHPMVLENGQVVEARTLEVGDVLLGEHGEPIVLTSIDTFTFEGQVWNLQPESELKQENILVAEGFLTGSLRFQNEWSEDATKLMRRDRIRIPRSENE